MSGQGKKKKTIGQKILAAAIMAGLGLAIGITFGKYIKLILKEQLSIGEELICIGLMLFVLALALWLQIIFHEFGHLVFGALTGYEFTSFRIGSFMWIREDGRLRCKRFSIAGTGGQCLMSPPDMKDGKFPIVLYNLGGSLMNLLVSGVCFVLAYIRAEIPVLFVIFWSLAITGLLSGLLNGIPLRLGMVDNDGYNALSLGKDREAMRSLWIQIKANAQVAEGVRMKDMPSEWFEMPSDTGLKNSMTAVLAVFACERLMDERRFAEAEECIEKLLEKDTAMVDIHRNLLICDLICAKLLGEDPKEKPDEFLTPELKKFMKTMKNYPSVLRTEYIYALLAAKDVKKAEGIKEQFEICARSYPYPNEIEAERELMDMAVHTF